MNLKYRPFAHTAVFWGPEYFHKSPLLLTFVLGFVDFLTFCCKSCLLFCCVPHLDFLLHMRSYLLSVPRVTWFTSAVVRCSAHELFLPWYLAIVGSVNSMFSTTDEAVRRTVKAEPRLAHLGLANWCYWSWNNSAYAAVWTSQQYNTYAFQKSGKKTSLCDSNERLTHVVLAFRNWIVVDGFSVCLLLVSMIPFLLLLPNDTDNAAREYFVVSMRCDVTVMRRGFVLGERP